MPSFLLQIVISIHYYFSCCSLRRNVIVGVSCMFLTTTDSLCYYCNCCSLCRSIIVGVSCFFFPTTGSCVTTATVAVSVGLSSSSFKNTCIISTADIVLSPKWIRKKLLYEEYKNKMILSIIMGFLQCD